MIPFIIFLSIFSTNSYLKTGCYNYLFKVSCDIDNNLSWSLNYDEIKAIQQNSKSWSRGFFHQKKESAIKDEKIYNSNFNWLSNWFKIHFNKKIIEFLLILFSIILLQKFFLFNKKKSKNNNNYLLIYAIISVFFWLYNYPQLRLGFASISILFFLIFDFFYKFNFNINRQRFSYLLILLIVFFNFSNFSRIKNEFEREDIYKFTNFPWFPNPNFSFETFYSNNIEYRVSRNNKEFWRTCWNIKPICVNHDDKISITKIGRKLIIEKHYLKNL